MNSDEVKAYLLDRNQEDIRQWLRANYFSCTSFEQKLIYLAHLITQDRYEDTVYFLVDIHDNDPTELGQLLNTSHALLDFGTILHSAVWWNAGKSGMDYVQLLCSYGALFQKNSRNQFPWEQKGVIWYTLLDHVDVGDREEEEFKPLYQELYDMYYQTIKLPLV